VFAGRGCRGSAGRLLGFGFWFFLLSGVFRSAEIALALDFARALIASLFKGSGLNRIPFGGSAHGLFCAVLAVLSFEGMQPFVEDGARGAGGG